MKRRNFILLSVSTAAFITIPFVRCTNRNAGWAKSLSRPLFLSQICDANTLREIGNAYRAQSPDEATENQLVNKILGDQGYKAHFKDENDPRFLAFLDEKILRDFSTDQTLIIKGWVVSATEARQCALASLIKP